MAKVSRVTGSTSHVLILFIQDSSSTTGAGLTGLAYNSASLSAYYKRNTGPSAVAVTLASIATLGTYVSGGFREIDAANMPGFYEFHPPDAAYASGAKSVAFMLKGAANMVVKPIEVELTAVDNQDATKGGIANLDAAISTRSVFAGGTVAGVTAPVTVGTNNDKSGYSLAVAPPTAIQVRQEMDANSTRLANLDATVSSRMATFTLPPNFTALGITAGGAISEVVLVDTCTANTDMRGTDSALLASGYTAPDNASIIGIKAKTDNLPASPAAVGSAMTLDLTQAVPTTNTAQTIGDALNAARADGFGKWVKAGATLTLYAGDGTTVVRTFSLDDATSPTQRV